MTVMIPVSVINEMLSELALRSKTISDQLSDDITSVGLARVLSAPRYKNEIETVRANEVFMAVMGLIKRGLFGDRMEIEKTEFMEFVYDRLVDHVALGNFDSAKVYASLTRVVKRYDARSA